MRDYSKPPPKPSAKRPKQGSVWIGLVVGLAIGVIGSAGFYWFKLRPANADVKTVKQPIPQSERDDLLAKEPVPAANTASSAGNTAANANNTTGNYTFYNQLKNFSVKIPDKEIDAQRDLTPTPETRPGSYILQAGSYPSMDEAEHKRAQLGLLGVEAHVQAASYENEKYYRVKIGPIQNLNQLNKIRENLRRAHVDVVTARVSD